MRHFAAAFLAVVGCMGQAMGQQGVSPGKALMERDPTLAFDPYTLLVRFLPGVPQVDRDLTRALLGAELMHEYHIVPDLELWLVPDAVTALDQLAFHQLIEYAELDWIARAPETEFRPIEDLPPGADDMIPNDGFFDFQWGMHNTGQVIDGRVGRDDADIDAPLGWTEETGSSSFVVAVIDSGTDWTHPDLAANIWSNPGEVINGLDDDGNGYVDDVRGWDFYSGDNNPMDEHGHGTHTAGTVGAIGNNGIGVAGVAWHIKIMPLRFLGPTGVGPTSGAISALEYAVDKGVRVSNNSWGSYSFSSSLNSAINAAKAIDHIFVASAGNDGVNTDVMPQFPSCFNQGNIISVAAINNRDKVPQWSNFGLTTVDLAAPGDDVASTYLLSQYVYSSGTSMAAPHVAGTAALLMIQNPTWSFQKVRNRILNTVRQTNQLNGITASGGVLNLADALGAGQAPPAAPSDLMVTDIGGGHAQLTWTDNADNETRFVIIRQERVGSSWTNKTNVAKLGANSTMYVDNPGTGKFRYRVRAQNQYGKSSWTSWTTIDMP